MNKLYRGSNTNTLVKIAVVQATPILYNKLSNIKRMSEITKTASENGAQIVMWPESFIPGYPMTLDIGNNPPIETINSEYRNFFANAISESDLEMNMISKIASQNHVYLLVGVTEREKDRMFCSEFIWSDTGKFLGKHRKSQPTGFENLIWQREEGSNLTVIDTPFGKIGTAICWENYMPLLRCAMYAENVKLYFAPAADSSDQWQSTLQHIALEGRCFVICCNHYIPDTDNSKSESIRNKYNGGSAVVSPQGEYVAGPLFNSEGILYATLNMNLCMEKRYDFDPCYPYTRNEYSEKI